MQTKCPKCYDLGLPGGCPRCGKDRKEIKHLDLSKTETIQNSNIIPSAYKGKVWSYQEHSRFFDNLEKIHKSCCSKEGLHFSLYIASNNSLDKMLFAYSCMQGLLLHNKSVSPLLSTSDLRRLMKVSQINPFFKLFGVWQYDSLMNLDVLFVTVSHLEETRYTDIATLREVLDCRARFGLPTVFLSDYPLESLVPKWDSRQYLTVYNTNPDRDYIRFPVILQEFKEE